MNIRGLNRFLWINFQLILKTYFFFFQSFDNDKRYRGYLIINVKALKRFWANVESFCQEISFNKKIENNRAMNKDVSLANGEKCHLA